MINKRVTSLLLVASLVVTMSVGVFADRGDKKNNNPQTQVQNNMKPQKAPRINPSQMPLQPLTTPPAVSFDVSEQQPAITDNVGIILGEVQNIDTQNVKGQKKGNVTYDQKDLQAVKKMQKQKAFKGFENYRIAIVSKIVTTSSAINVEGFVLISNHVFMMSPSMIEKAFDAKVIYVKADRKYVVSKAGTTVEIFVNRMVAEINGKPVKIEQKPIIVNNKAMLPVNILAKAFGVKVSYAPDSNTLSVLPKTVITPPPTTTSSAITIN